MISSLKADELAMSHVTREYVSDPALLAEIRAFVKEVCSQALVSEDDADLIEKVVLAAQEAVTNIMRHVYEGETDLPIKVTLDIDPCRVCVCLYHRCRDFDPNQVPLPSFDGSRRGGFGIYLMKQLVDELQYVYEGNKCCGIRLVKFRKNPRKGTTVCNFRSNK